MTPLEPRPRLSIVVASRNDDHGGNILTRMRIFVRGLYAQARRHGLTAELIVVEWNPPPDRPPLSAVLPAPASDDAVTVRYITVPASVHRRYRRAPDIPLFQMIAKNVGIRRASGAFVLCTNVDLLFSDALARLLASAPLRGDTFYRANRCDVPDAIDPERDTPRQLAWCEAHVIRRLGRDPRHRAVNLEALGMQGGNAAKVRLAATLAWGLRLFWRRERLRFFQLDTFACGDFTLMTKEAWHAIDGYVELDLYSLHVDSLALIAAAALGYRQHVFPRQACTYHIDHPSGWERLSPLEKVRFLERRPALDYTLLYEIALEAMEARRAPRLNAPDWGCADLDLEECVVRPGPAAEPARLAGSGS